MSTSQISNLESAPPRRWTFDEVWSAEFAPAYRETQRRLSEHRTEAFLDAALTLCGEPVRQMTPHDMLHLDALGNPFIAGSEDGTVHFLDCAGLVWQLHTENNQTSSLANLLRRARVIRRLAALELRPMAREISAYVDRMLLDPARPSPASPASSQSPESSPSSESSSLQSEPKTHFLAGLIVNLAAEIGHIDPMGGQLLAHSPLPRLLQYRAASASEKGEVRQRDEADSLRNRCLARLNELNASPSASPPSPASSASSPSSS